jgi:hypothetical protein
MPITRTPWIDDDGTGTTGTIINNAEKTLLYNQIDALVAPFLAPLALGPHWDMPQITSGQRDNVVPDATGAARTIWFMSSTVATFLTGIQAPTIDGTVHLLVNTSGPTITIAHLFGSSAANQFIGAGYANTDVTSWRVMWIEYNSGLAKWLVLKPSA